MQNPVPFYKLFAVYKSWICHLKTENLIYENSECYFWLCSLVQEVSTHSQLNVNDNKSNVENILSYVTEYLFKNNCYNIGKYSAEEQIYKIWILTVNIWLFIVTYCKAGHIVLTCNFPWSDMLHELPLPDLRPDRMRLIHRLNFLFKISKEAGEGRSFGLGSMLTSKTLTLDSYS